MRDTFVKTLVELAKENKNIELLTGDLGFGVLKQFWEQCPYQFTNIGIAEQNMTGIAAGMALENKIVFTYSIGNFPTLRCLEQIRNDCAYHNANVKIVCIGGGFAYGSSGMSHHATEDMAILRALPNVTVICPGDLIEAAEATKAIVNYPGTCYLRLGRGGEKRIHEKIDNFQIGKAIKIKENIKKNKDMAIFSTGAILDVACEVVEELINLGYGIVQYSFPTVKPIDKKVIKKCIEEYKQILTIEEHNIVGGFGSAVAEVMAENEGIAKLKRFGLNNSYTKVVGSQNYLRNEYGLSKEKIVREIEKGRN